MYDFIKDLGWLSELKDEPAYSSRFDEDKEMKKGRLDDTKIFLKEMRVRHDIIKNKTLMLIRNSLSDLVLPRKDEQLRIRTQQQINLVSIILKMLSVHSNIEELTIATYTLNKETLNILIDLIKSGKIKRMNLFIASSYSFRHPTYYEEMKSLMRELSFRKDVHLTFAWSHFKITLARCKDNFYQIEGSMNYSQNNMAEQIVFENSKETYTWDYKFINTLMISSEKAFEVIC